MKKTSALDRLRKVAANVPVKELTDAERDAAYKAATDAGWVQEESDWWVNKAQRDACDSDHIVTKFVKPRAGMPCTIQIGSDFYDATVVGATPATLSVVYNRDPDEVVKFTKRKDGVYRNGHFRISCIGASRGRLDESF